MPATPTLTDRPVALTGHDLYLFREGTHTRLYEKLGAAEAAVGVFQRVQALQPQNARATRALREIYAQAGDFEALEKLFAGQGNYEDLCETLTTLADATFPTVGPVS